MPELVGTLIVRNANAYIMDGTKREIPLWAWLCSHGLKDKEIKITVEKINEDDKTERS